MCLHALIHKILDRSKRNSLISGRNRKLFYESIRIDLKKIQKKTEIIAQLSEAKLESSCGDVPRLIHSTRFSYGDKLVYVAVTNQTYSDRLKKLISDKKACERIKQYILTSDRSRIVDAINALMSTKKMRRL